MSTLLIELTIVFIVFVLFMYNLYLYFGNRKAQNIDIKKIGSNLEKNQTPDKKTQEMFDRAKNPWKMTIARYKAIRSIGGIAGSIIAVIGFFAFGLPYGVMPGAIIFGLAWYYPSYYYNSIGNERELEWNKMYQFIWILKNNLSLYDPKQAFINTGNYISKNFPENKEIIQGFSDMAEYFSEEEVHPYIKQYYSFSVPKEIAQIAYNSQATGTAPDKQLDQLRIFTLNQQDKSVVSILSKTSSTATIASLPFMLISMILALMVPMLMNFIKLM